MLSEEGRDRVKQRHTIHPVRDAGDTERGEGSEQSAGEPPTGGVRGGVRPAAGEPSHPAASFFSILFLLKNTLVY